MTAKHRRQDRTESLPSKDESTEKTGGSHASSSLTGPAYDALLSRALAGLSVSGNVLLMVHGVFINLSIGSLPRHKVDVFITLQKRYRTGNDKVGTPAWTIPAAYMITYLRRP